MNERTEPFDWQPLGEAWWRQAADDLRMKVSDKQIRIACAKHRGCTDAEAARQAGYGGSEETVRQAAYKAVRTTAVKELLAFAASEGRGPTTGFVESAEAKQILSNLARSKDPNTSIRAIEQLSKLKEKEAAFGQSVEGDGFSDWRLCRDYLAGMPGGAAAWVQVWTAQGKSLSGLDLLHDVRRLCLEQDPDLWERKVRESSPAERAWLERSLANPDWQREARIKLWKEIGVDIEGGSNSRLRSASEDDTTQATAIPFNGDIVGHDNAGDSAWEEESEVAEREYASRG